MHECNPIEGSPKTHWNESGGNGWTVCDDKRDQRQFKEREVVRQSDGTNTEAHKSLNEEVSRPMTDA